MSNDVSRVPHYDGSSSYSMSGIPPQGNPHEISHVQKYGKKVQELNLWTNPSGHESIGNNLADGGIPHGDSHPICMKNMDDGTTIHCSNQPSNTNDWRHGMSNNVSQVLNHNVKSSYSLSHVIPQDNPRGISHVREHDNKVQESNLRTNRSGHDSIVNNLTDGGMPHSDSRLTGMQNMDDSTMSSCSTFISLGPPNTTCESPYNYNHDYSHSSSSTSCKL